MDAWSALLAGMTCLLLVGLGAVWGARRRRDQARSLDQELSSVREMAMAGQALQAIALLRSVTGKSLADAADMVQPMLPAPPQVPEPQEPAPSPSVERLVRQKRIMEAIRTYQEQSGVDPAQAREVVERLRNGIN